MAEVELINEQLFRDAKAGKQALRSFKRCNPDHYNGAVEFLKHFAEITADEDVGVGKKRKADDDGPGRKRPRLATFKRDVYSKENFAATLRELVDKAKALLDANGEYNIKLENVDELSQDKLGVLAKADLIVRHDTFARMEQDATKVRNVALFKLGQLYLFKKHAMKGGKKLAQVAEFFNTSIPKVSVCIRYYMICTCYPIFLLTGLSYSW